MRQFLLQLAEDGNPINLDIIEEVGQFPTRKAAAAWAARQENQGNLTHVGTMKDSNGRKVLKVWCNSWNPKEDNLRHEIIGTRVRMLYPAYDVQRGPGLQCWCDMVMSDGEHTYEVEIECGTHKQQKFKWRVKRHKCENDILFVVAPKTGNAEDRMRRIMEWSQGLGERAVFTTLERLKTRGPHTRVWDYLGRENARLKRVKFPVASAYQKYMETTLQMAATKEDSEE